VIDSSLVDYLNGGPEPPTLELDLYIDTTLLWMWRALRTSDDLPDGPPTNFVRLGHVFGDRIPGTRQLINAQSICGYAWLSLAWRAGVASAFVNPFSSETVSLRKQTDFPRRAQALFRLAYVRATIHRWLRRLRFRLR
jgi:hypothetical protein